VIGTASSSPRLAFWRWDWQTFQHLLLIALPVALGLQMLRGFMAGLVFYLRDGQEIGAPFLGLYAFLLFLLGFAAWPLIRVAGTKALLTTSVLGLAGARIAEQASRSPLADLVLTSIGTLFFLICIPVIAGFLGRARRGRTLAVGLLMGVSVDTAVKGVFATRELSWVTGWVGYLPLVLIMLLLVWSLLRLFHAFEAQGSLNSRNYSWAAFGIGPALVLELLLLQNIGQQTIFMGLSQAQVFGWVALSNLLAVAAAAFAPKRSLSRVAMVLEGGGLVALVLVHPSGWAAGVVQLVAQIVVALFILRIGFTIEQLRSTPPLGGLVLPWVAGMLVLMVLLFSYYASVDLAIPLPRPAVAPIAAGFLALGAFLGTRATAPATASQEQSQPRDSLALAASIALLVLPLGYLATHREASPAAGAGFPLRVVTYNVHMGFDPQGHASIEAILESIRREKPDLVALQEVSRAWLTAGSFDMLPWLARELNMRYVWGPSVDSAWGNAVLSRYPVISAELHPMPNNDDLLITRAFLVVTVDTGPAGPLRVIATHLHHTDSESYRRVPQVEALLGAWGRQVRTIILGDFNVRPGEPEDAMLEGAGLRDAFVLTGSHGTNYTSRSFVRIDRVWLSPDLDARDYSVSGDFASDHLPVAVTILPAGR